MRIALAQLNPVVGDFEGNARRILEAVRRAEEQAVELVLTRSCGDVSKAMYLLRCMGDRLETMDTTAFDDSLREALES